MSTPAPPSRPTGPDPGTDSVSGSGSGSGTGLRSRVARAGVILLILAATLFLGETYGPQRAQADVYKVLQARANTVLTALTLDPHVGGERILVLNGNRMRLNLSRSDQDPAELLDRLEALTEHNWKASQPAPPGEANPALFGALARPFRIDRDNWGLYGRFVMSNDADPEELLQGLFDGRGLGADSRDGFILIASRPDPAQPTQVWTLRFEAGLNPFTLAGMAQRDDARNIIGVAPYPGSERIVSLSEFTTFSAAHVLGYAGRDDVRKHAAHYRLQFEKQGMQLLSETHRGARETLLMFQRNGGDTPGGIAVFISPLATDPSQTLALIQLRSSS